ncbi:MAG: DUF1236 domain-containing protein [Devosia sp.]|jgi:hypothetical protein
MHKITASLAFLALLGATAAATPSLAQSTTTTTMSRGSIDCSLPANYNNPYCVRLRGQGHTGSGYGTNGALGSGGSNNNNAAQGGQGGNALPSPNNSGPKPGSFNWSSHDRDMFHQRFRGFNFGTFGTPNFTIHLGIGVPHSYYHNLRPVPRSIYRYYPWFRGYLYFVRGGQFVIVSPRTYRIVAVI